MPPGPSALYRRFRQWRRSAELAVARKFGLATREDKLFLVAIALVGILAGFLGVAVHRLIDALQTLLWGSSNLLAAALEVPWWRALAAPVVGGLLIALIVRLGRGASDGPGMGILIEAVALRGGRLPPRSIIVSSLAAIATVGSGGSLGREGPMIRLGAMISSELGRRFRLAPHRVKILVGCGAAAGLAAAYNIPIGGALFAMEVVLGNFALQIFGPIVAASVLSTLIARSFEGATHRFALGEFHLASGWEILAYAALGLVCAVASIVFVLGVRRLAAAFERIPIPAWVRPIPGMALFGLLALYVPQVLEGGQEVTNVLIEDRLVVPGWLSGLGLPAFLLVLAGIKIVAVALTDGAGGVGGKFTPSLLFGALVGGAFGMLVEAAFPGQTAGFPAYAAVGMAAIAAGTSHAPISAILTLFEFTGNYDLILPLMVASILSSVVSRKLYPYSIYTETLQRRGVDLNMRLEEAVLAGLGVKDLLRDDPDTLSPSAGYREVVDRFFAARRSRLFVLDGERRLLGEVSFHDIKHVLDQPSLLTAVVAHDLMRSAEHVLRFEDRLDQAAEVFAHSDWERLPVVDADGGFRGILSKRDLLAIYAQEVLGRQALLATFVAEREGEATRDYVELPPDFTLRLVEAPKELAGKTLAEARLPQAYGVRVIEIKRGSRLPMAAGGVGWEPGEERVIPGGETVLLPGDRLIVLGPTAAVERLAEGRAVATTEAEAMMAID